MQETGKVLIAGATGALGMEIVKELHKKNIPMRGLTRSGNLELEQLTGDVFTGDASEDTVAGVTEGVTTVISSLGKSVSLFTPTDESFFESDYIANKNILDDALKHGVKRFIYVSIKGADSKEGYTIAKAHKMFEDYLRNSGIDYTIVRPVGFFSGLNDLAILAKRQIIPIVGDGKAKTNSIHHKDLAKVMVGFLNDGPKVVEIGGPKIHTREEMAEMVKEKIGGQIIKVPEVFADFGVELQKIFSEDVYNKLDYFKYVTTNDMIAEPHGTITFQQYLNSLDPKDLP